MRTSPPNSDVHSNLKISVRKVAVESGDVIFIFFTAGWSMSVGGRFCLLLEVLPRPMLRVFKFLLVSLLKIGILLFEIRDSFLLIFSVVLTIQLSLASLSQEVASELLVFDCSIAGESCLSLKLWRGSETLLTLAVASALVGGGGSNSTRYL